MAKTIERVLIYRLGSLGDTIVALPALRVVARAFPGADRAYLTNIPVNAKAPAAAAVLENTGLVQRYLRYTVGTRSPRELLALWWRIVRYRPQALVYLAAARGVPTAKRDVAFFRLCGITKFYGAPLTEALQENAYQPEYDALEPEAEHLCRRIAELGEARLGDPASWDMCLTPAELERGRAVLASADGRPVMAVSLGTKVQAKDWGRENWKTLLGEIAARYPGYCLLLAGAPEESEASEYAAEAWRAQAGAGPVVNVCGKLTLRETAAAFAQAKIFIGHDSGPMHLAATVQVPCVAIFAARNIPRQWFPFGHQHRVLYHRVECWGCGLETCIEQQKKCLMSITVDEVMEAIIRMLASSKP